MCVLYSILFFSVMICSGYIQIYIYILLGCTSFSVCGSSVVFVLYTAFSVTSMYMLVFMFDAAFSENMCSVYMPFRGTAVYSLDDFDDFHA